jgi:hypothetical protein
VAKACPCFEGLSRIGDVRRCGDGLGRDCFRFRYKIVANVINLACAMLWARETVRQQELSRTSPSIPLTTRRARGVAPFATLCGGRLAASLSRAKKNLSAADLARVEMLNAQIVSCRYVVVPIHLFRSRLSPPGCHSSLFTLPRSPFRYKLPVNALARAGLMAKCWSLLRIGFVPSL